MRISDWSSDVCSSDLSSLAAREPALYNYGWSKERAEAIVQGSGLDWTIVRPPAVFGPGDTEMLDLFRMARRGIALVPSGRMSAIYVDELARLLVTLAADRTASRSEEHTSELQSLMRISYAVFCLKQNNTTPQQK